MLNAKELVEDIPIGEWVEKEKNVWVINRGDTYGFIYPNVSNYGKVNQWQSSVYRLVYGVRIESKSIKSSDLEECKSFIDKEIWYLLTIQCPFREVKDD